MILHQEEYQQLEYHFSHAPNEIAILYGDRQCDLQGTIAAFLKNKSYFYYRARSCSSRLQLQFFYDEIREELPKGMKIDLRYSEIISAMLSITCEKRVIVIDEFHHIIKSDPDLIDELIRTVHNKWNNQKVLFLLCSSQVNWVERDMVELLQNKAYEINALIKLKERSFADLRSYFSEYDFIDSVVTLGIFGAYPGNWKMLDPARSLQENICRTLLTKGSYFYEKGIHILPDELREPAVYHTILQALSSGPKKLNDIHKLTGFERAKISVYLKNLIDLSIVEKTRSYDAPGHDNVQKGIYRITDPFLQFWFCFVFPHYSKLARMESDKFYRKYVESGLRSYAGSAYSQVCREYLLNLHGPFESEGVWFGKVGTIDIIARDRQQQTIAGYCNFEKVKMSYADLEWNRYCMEQAGIGCDRLYLFSHHSFDEKLKKEAVSDPTIVLVEGDF